MELKEFEEYKIKEEKERIEEEKRIEEENLEKFIKKVRDIKKIKTELIKNIGNPFYSENDSIKFIINIEKIEYCIYIKIIEYDEQLLLETKVFKKPIIFEELKISKKVPIKKEDTLSYFFRRYILREKYDIKYKIKKVISKNKEIDLDLFTIKHEKITLESYGHSCYDYSSESLEEDRKEMDKLYSEKDKIKFEDFQRNLNCFHEDNYKIREYLDYPKLPQRTASVFDHKFGGGYYFITSIGELYNYNEGFFDFVPSLLEIKNILINNSSEELTNIIQKELEKVKDLDGRLYFFRINPIIEKETTIYNLLYN